MKCAGKISREKLYQEAHGIMGAYFQVRDSFQLCFSGSHLQ